MNREDGERNKNECDKHDLLLPCPRSQCLAKYCMTIILNRYISQDGRDEISFTLTTPDSDGKCDPYPLLLHHILMYYWWNPEVRSCNKSANSMLVENITIVSIFTLFLYSPHGTILLTLSSPSPLSKWFFMSNTIMPSQNCHCTEENTDLGTITAKAESYTWQNVSYRVCLLQSVVGMLIAIWTHNMFQISGLAAMHLTDNSRHSILTNVRWLWRDWFTFLMLADALPDWQGTGHFGFSFSSTVQ